MWSAIQKVIPIGENLQRRGVTQEAKCIRCGELESEAHIFFKCDFAKKVWQQFNLSPTVDIASQTRLKAVLVTSRTNCCLPPLGVTTNILPWIFWSLWTARNTLIFEKKTYTVEDTAIRGIKLAREWIQAEPAPHASSVRARRGITNRPRLETTHRSSTDITSCKTDAAWDKKTNTAGISWIIEDLPRSIDLRGVMVQQNVSSPLVAEALAVREALQTASSLSVTHLRMYSDNQTLIRAINEKLFEKEIYGILNDIEAFFSLFVDLVFFYLPRAENGHADALAKYILRNPNHVMDRPMG
ncbi:uncharacterized protein LOC125595980 [Brassica napus]|nr:uncharacterized protein LOC106453708 [Brassica napus]XP_048627291.1 uncharacterized protein LOC125595980 [Brassica napus]